MQKIFSKRVGMTVVSALLAVALAVPVSLIAIPPKRVEAQASSACVAVFVSLLATILGAHAASSAFVPTNRPGAAASEANSGAQSKMTYIKECIEKKLVFAMVRRMLDQMTNDIVSWINGGFDGKPAFAMNPKKFLQDAADETLGEFILGTELGFLCSPFEIQVRLALALNYSTSYQKQARCTLSQIFNNVDGAFEDLGGGWDGWLSITQSTSNNPFGSYLTSHAKAGARAGGRQSRELIQLNWGGGFLSYKKCEAIVRDSNGDPVMTTDPQTGKQVASTTKYTGYGGSAEVSVLGESQTFSDQRSPEDNCQTVTPGTLITAQMGETLAQPLRELGVAEDIDKILNALFNKVLSNVFGGDGLFGLGSQHGGNNSNDRLRKFIDESEQNEDKTKGQADDDMIDSDNVDPAGDGGNQSGNQQAQNVAARGVVSQTPAFQFSNPEALVDGSRSNMNNGEYNGALTGQAAAPQVSMQVTFDQAKTYQLDKIFVYPRPSTTDALVSFVVQVLNSSGSVVWQSTTQTHNGGNPFYLDVPAGISGNAVKLQGVGTGIGRIEIAELEAYTRKSPIIKLNGSPSMTIPLNSQFNDPGATATDAEGNAVTVTKSGSVNTSVASTYEITYTATDAKGATATARRTVTVIQGYGQ